MTTTNSQCSTIRLIIDSDKMLCGILDTNLNKFELKLTADVDLNKVFHQNEGLLNCLE